MPVPDAAPLQEPADSTPARRGDAPFYARSKAVLAGLVRGSDLLLIVLTALIAY